MDTERAGDDDSGAVDLDIVRLLEQGVEARLRKLKDAPDSVTEGIYAQGYAFYQAGQLTQAERCFRFLCLYDVRQRDYLFALAAVYQLQQQPHKAATLYAVAYGLSRDDDEPLVLAGRCLLQLQRHELARDCFERVLEHSADPALRDQAQRGLQAAAAPPPRVATATELRR